MIRRAVAAILLAAIAPAAASACDLDGFMGHRFSSLQSQYDPNAIYSTDETRSADASSSDTPARDYYAAADAASAAEAQPAPAPDPSKPQRDYR